MMHFALFDSTGNLIESFDVEDEARAALQRIVDNEPDAADDVALFILNEHGSPIADPVTIDASGSYVGR